MEPLGRLRHWQLPLLVAFLVIQAGSLLLFRPSLPPQIPLLYTRPWGEDQLVTRDYLWLLPTLGALAGTGMALVSYRTNDRFLLTLLIITNLTVGLILTLALLRIVLLFI